MAYSATLPRRMQREDVGDIAAARDAMNTLPLLDRAAVFVEPLLTDREETTRAIAALLGSLRVLALRLPDPEREAIAMQMIEEARRVVAGWLH
jgi:hypothetical protein